MLRTEIKLNLRQNAVHTLYHAVEHLYWAESQSDAKEGMSYNHDEHTVEWRNELGHRCSYLADFTRLPSVYSLKFALLHLIQAAELLLKAFVEESDPTAVFVKAGSRRTIDLRTALNFAVDRNPMLLSRSDYALLLEAKDLRNEIEHYQFAFEESRLRRICADFLGSCALLAQSLLSLNIVDAFYWDCLRDEPDKVAEYMSTILSGASEAGRDAAKRSGFGRHRIHNSRFFSV